MHVARSLVRRFGVGSRIGIMKGAAVLACAMAAVSCSGSGGTAAPEAASTSASATVTVLPPPLTRTSSAAPAPAQTQTETETVTVPAAAPATVVPCVDPSSSGVQAALAKVGRDVNGGTFEPYQWTQGTSADGCPDLEWLLANGNGIGDATYQSHVLFFRNTGTFLGTATLKPTSYTTVTGSNSNSVQVKYQWLNADDAFCCPTGGPSYVTFTLDGDRVVPDGQFPPGI